MLKTSCQISVIIKVLCLKWTWSVCIRCLYQALQQVWLFAQAQFSSVWKRWWVWVIFVLEKGTHIYFPVLSHNVQLWKKADISLQSCYFASLFRFFLWCWTLEEWKGVFLDGVMNWSSAVYQNWLVVFIILALSKFFHCTDSVGHWFIHHITSIQHQQFCSVIHEGIAHITDSLGKAQNLPSEALLSW